MSADNLLSQVYKHMDPKTGEFPADWCCLGCGKRLNADGGHPAEIYAGTYNGLCYPCTSKPFYVEYVDELDGAKRMNYPPHCPSWRRSRETYWAYDDCENCQGAGVRGRGWTNPGSCRQCSSRYYTHPLRKWAFDRRSRIFRAAQASYERALLKEANLPKRVSKKRQREAQEAIHSTEAGRLIRDEVLRRSDRIRDCFMAFAERRTNEAIEERHNLTTPSRSTSINSDEHTADD